MTGLTRVCSIKTMSLVRDRFNDWSYESVFHKTMSLVRDRFND